MMPNGSKKNSKGEAAHVKLWDWLSASACCLMLVFGLAVWAVSGHSLSGVTAAHGQFLGLSCMGLACLGILASLLPISAPSSASPALGGFNTSPSPSTAKQLASKCSLPLRIGLLVGLGLSALGSLLLLDQVAHDVGAHCVVAEASVRINHLEEAVTKLKHDELLTQVFFRLNELDDLMSGVAQSTTSHAELRSQTFHMQLQDRDLIRERVERLRRHAEQLLDDMAGSVARVRLELSEANTEQNLQQEGVAGAPQAPFMGNAAGSSSRRPARSMEEIQQEGAKLQRVVEEKKAKEQSLWILERRIEAVQSVLQYLDARSHDAHAALTFEEYEVILNALLEGATNLPDPSGNSASEVSEPKPASPITAVVRENLAKDKADVSDIKGAFGRRKSGAYEKAAGPPSKATKEVAARQQKARAEWEARFFGSFEEGVGHTNPSIFSSTLAQALDSLPRHCLDDVAAYATLRWLGLGLIIAQTVAGYVAATSLATRIVAASKDE